MLIDNSEIIIIGAGISGLSLALHLKKHGIYSVILEKDKSIGGRIKTENYQGFLLDHGFQVLLPDYPECLKLYDLKNLDLCYFPRATEIQYSNQNYLLADPLKFPLMILKPFNTPFITKSDIINLIKLRLKVALDKDVLNSAFFKISTNDYLIEEGFSKSIIDNLFRPFFGGVFLEKNLSTNAALFRFLFKMFAGSGAAIPAYGMQQLPQKLFEKLDPNQVKLNCEVTSIDNLTLTINKSDKITAKKIIVTDGILYNKLFNPKSNVEFHETTTLYFNTNDQNELPNYLLLNPNAINNMVNNLCIISKVAPNYAPKGKNLIVASVLKATLNELDLTNSISLEIKNRLKLKHLEHLKNFQIKKALPVFNTNTHNLGDFYTTHPNIYRCGDFTGYPSINSALLNARKLAQYLVSKN
jgi:protoporphyrinogen oxidase